jgi:MFS family permease
LRIHSLAQLQLVPPLTLLYLLSFLDRVNIGQAKIDGLTADLHLVGNQYNIALVVFFVSYVAFEIPSNFLLKRFRPTIWIPCIMVAWSIVLIFMGFVHDYAGLTAARFFLGLAESGLFPGLVRPPPRPSLTPD